MSKQNTAQDFDSQATYSFPPEGRELWAEKMKMVGYVEMAGYVGAKTTDGNYVRYAYCCANCPYMQVQVKGQPNVTTPSPTGYWCKEFDFPDRPWGCCDGWKPLTEPPPPMRPGESGLKFVGGD